MLFRSAFHPHLQETAPGRRETFPQHSWLRDGLGSALPDQLSRGPGTCSPGQGLGVAFPVCKGRCALPWSLAARERARPPGSALDHPLTPSSKGRGVGLGLDLCFLSLVCPVCEPLPLTCCPGGFSGSPETVGADQAEVASAGGTSAAPCPSFSLGLGGKL